MLSRLCFIAGILIVFFSGCLEQKEKEVIKYKYIYTEVSKDEDDRLEITDVTWEWEEFYSSGYLTAAGKVKNTGTVKLEYIKIFFKSYDTEKNLISEDYGFAKNSQLLPGSQTTWEVSDFDCKTRPQKITVGYSYDVEIIIPASKGILNP